METATIKIDGMTCGGCVASVTRAIKRLDGVQDVTVTLQPAQATVTYDRLHVDESSLVAAIKDAGYGANT